MTSQLSLVFAVVGATLFALTEIETFGCVRLTLRTRLRFDCHDIAAFGFFSPNRFASLSAHFAAASRTGSESRLCSGRGPAVA
jgi:hypothetical protein